MYSWWTPCGAWYRDNRGTFWQGPEQVEDKSRANVARAYDYLLKLPYQSTEDRERLEEQRFIQMLKAKPWQRPRS